MLESLIQKADGGKGSANARMAFFMTTATDELAEELGELDEAQVRLYLFQIGEVISWIGHGINDRLPEEIRPFADLINPSGTSNADASGDAKQSSPLAIDPATG